MKKPHGMLFLSDCEIIMLPSQMMPVISFATYFSSFEKYEARSNNGGGTSDPRFSGFLQEQFDFVKKSCRQPQK